MTIYVGDIGNVIDVECTEDISAATTTELHVLKPDGTTANWDAVLYGTTGMRYTSVSGDFDQAGIYRIQAYAATSTWEFHGDTDSFMVLNTYTR